MFINCLWSYCSTLMQCQGKLQPVSETDKALSMPYRNNLQQLHYHHEHCLSRVDRTNQADRAIYKKIYKARDLAYIYVFICNRSRGFLSGNMVTNAVDIVTYRWLLMAAFSIRFSRISGIDTRATYGVCWKPEIGRARRFSETMLNDSTGHRSSF